MALRHLCQSLHQARQLQVGAERLRPRGCLAAWAGRRAVRRRLPGRTTQTGTAEAVAALCGHGRVEKLQTQRAGQLLVQEAGRSRHGGPGYRRGWSERLSVPANPLSPSPGNNPRPPARVSVPVPNTSPGLHTGLRTAHHCLSPKFSKAPYPNLSLTSPGTPALPSPITPGPQDPQDSQVWPEILGKKRLPGGSVRVRPN